MLARFLVAVLAIFVIGRFLQHFERSPAVETQVAARVDPPPPLPQPKTVTEAQAQMRRASSPITREQFPKLFARLGPVAIARANELVPHLGVAIAADPRCGRLDLVSLSVYAASGSDLRFIADCSFAAPNSVARYTISQIEAERIETSLADLAGTDPAPSDLLIDMGIRPDVRVW